MTWRKFSLSDNNEMPTQKEMMLAMVAEALRLAIGIGAFLLGWHFLSCALDMIVR